jgi:hypothetical protein
MRWTAERTRQQGRLMAELFEAAGAVPQERSAVIAGGLPGADKAVLLEKQGIDPSRYLTVSVGAVLTAMAARQLIPAVAGRSPLSAVGSAHAEAQYLAKRMALVAVNDGVNVILDVPLVSRPSAESWIYALRFADYAVTAVFAGTSVAEAIARTAADAERGEEAYRRGHGYGGRPIAAGAIRALDGPEAAAARDSIRWASGAEPTSVTAGAAGGGGLPGGAVAAMISAYRRGQLTLAGLGLEFRARRWPGIPPVCPPSLQQAAEAIDDLEPYVPGSFDDVVLAYDLGQLTGEDYEFLAEAAS